MTMPRSDRGGTLGNCTGELKGIALLKSPCASRGGSVHAFGFDPIDIPRELCQTFPMNAQVSPLLNVELSRSGLLPQSNLTAQEGKTLTLEDLGLLATTKVGGTQVLKRLRASHHHAARLLAQGCKPGEVSALSGFCLSRISVLQADPAFSELVAHYTTVEEARFADVQERMVLLGLSASEEIMDRLDTEPELISTKELVEVVKASLDRGGHAPVAKSENKNLSIVLGADDLEALKSRGGATILDKATINDKESIAESEEAPLGETGSTRAIQEQESRTDGLPSAGDTV